MANTTETAVFGGGCFWCTEAVFSHLKGVLSVMPGYTGGSVVNPSYEQVSAGDTGHVECTKIDFDPAVISFAQLLAVFFNTHDPTTLNRQGADIGEQYQSSIFYTNPAQKQQAESLIKELTEKQAYQNPTVTKVRPLETFYEAEDYHRKYYEAHKDAPYCELVIAPKLEHLEREFRELVK